VKLIKTERFKAVIIMVEYDLLLYFVIDIGINIVIIYYNDVVTIIKYLIVIIKL